MTVFRRRKTVDSLARSSTSSWRQYQFSLRKKSAARQTLKRLPAYLIILVLGILSIKV